MSDRFRKALTTVLTLATVMAYYTAPAQAALMKDASVTLSDPRGGTTSSYKFSMKTATQGEIKGIRMAWRTDASSSSQHPTSGAWSAAVKSATEPSVGLPGDWTNDWSLDTSDNATGVLYLHNSGATSINAGTTIGWTLNGIGNPSIAAPIVGCTPNGTNNSAGTCYLRLQTYKTATIADMRNQVAEEIIDDVTITFTVVASVVVSAKVDPSLTFTVDGVAGATNANGVSTSHTSTFSTLPFGNLATNTPKYLAQDLRVRTNAVNGYTVNMKLYTQMTGKYTNNNIDPFIGSAASWDSPQAWTSPNGNEGSVNTGWLGANTNNAGVGTWSTAGVGKWGPVPHDTTSAATPVTVMSSIAPDNGASATRVTFALEVNVYQPSDSYEGILVYNCVPKY